MACCWCGKPSFPGVSWRGVTHADCGDCRLPTTLRSHAKPWFESSRSLDDAILDACGYDIWKRDPVGDIRKDWLNAMEILKRGDR
jgi:hypothetical protein